MKACDKCGKQILSDILKHDCEPGTHPSIVEYRLRYMREAELKQQARVETLKAGKAQMELLEPRFVEGLAQALAYGAKKYAPGGYRDGVKVAQYFGALLRHVFAVMRGEEKDAESGLDHLFHAAANCMIAWWILKNRPDMDDRVTKEQ